MLESEIDITLVNQLKTLYGFSDKELIEFYNAFKELELNKKEELLIDFDSRLKERKKQLSDFLTKIKISSNKMNELIEKKDLEDINL